MAKAKTTKPEAETIIEDVAASAEMDAPETAAEVKRVYKGTQELDHDLFKLKAAAMKKNVSFTEMPIYEHFEHCHIFHTIDSSGKKQETCNAVGGHTHQIQIVPNGAGVPKVVVSGPKKWIREKVRGQFRTVLADIEDDRHTHEVEYLGSERIKMRQPNVEFAKFDMALRAKQETTIDGVIG